MAASDPLSAAVAENAAWCDLVCRAAGIPTARDDRVWRSPERTPRYFPDAMTLAPDASVAEVLDRIDLSSGCSIKDSFATLDLHPRGFEILFEAQWIHAYSATRGRSSWTSRASRYPGASTLTGDTGRLDAHPHGSSVGISNLEGSWPDALDALATVFPGASLVGYEHGDDLDAAVAAGFTTVGPLRVWVTSA